MGVRHRRGKQSPATHSCALCVTPGRQARTTCIVGPSENTPDVRRLFRNVVGGDDGPTVRWAAGQAHAELPPEEPQAAQAARPGTCLHAGHPHRSWRSSAGRWCVSAPRDLWAKPSSSVAGAVTPPSPTVMQNPSSPRKLRPDSPLCRGGFPGIAGCSQVPAGESQASPRVTPAQPRCWSCNSLSPPPGEPLQLPVGRGHPVRTALFPTPERQHNPTLLSPGLAPKVAFLLG